MPKCLITLLCLVEQLCNCFVYALARPVVKLQTSRNEKTTETFKNFKTSLSGLFLAKVHELDPSLVIRPWKDTLLMDQHNSECILMVSVERVFSTRTRKTVLSSTIQVFSTNTETVSCEGPVQCWLLIFLICRDNKDSVWAEIFYVLLLNHLRCSKMWKSHSTI